MYLCESYVRPYGRPSKIPEREGCSWNGQSCGYALSTGSFWAYHRSIQRKLYLVSEKPIHSVLVGRKSFCFTYFSALNDYWKSFRMDLSKIYIAIKDDFIKLFPVFTHLIAIHSNNILPNYNPLDYFSVNPNVNYDVKYNKLNIKLVLERFESNCAEYDIVNERDSNRMHSDCLVKCYSAFFKEKYKCLTKDLKFLITKDLVSSFGNVSINLNITEPDGSDHEDTICYDRCKPDCNTEKYLTDIRATKIVDLEQVIKLVLYHNSIPDIIVRHSLEMSLMSFVCNFGGLLGMWLGFSVLTLS